MKTIVVILPTYNEIENIGEMIEVLENNIFPKIDGYSMSILVVDDNSPDGTGKEAAKFRNVLVISRPAKLGLGSAYVLSLIHI